MPEVRATTSFFDVAGKTVRHVGSEWYCEEGRAYKLASYGLVEVIGVPKFEEQPEPEPEPAPEPEPEPKPRRTRKKKA